MYYKCAQNGYVYNYLEFVLGYNVLIELDIIYIENNLIRFSTEKKDLAQSEILKLAGRN